MVTATTATRLREDIVRLGHRGLRAADFARAAGDALTRVIPADGTCVMTVDPATLLPTAEYVDNGLPAPELLRMIDIELREPDVNKWVDLGQSTTPAASLSHATRGDLEVSLRQREIRRPGGFADELRVVLTTGTGMWGQLTVFRERRRPYFSSAEVGLVSSVAASIAEGLRRAVLLEAGRDGRTDVGVLVLDVDDRPLLTNPTAERWLDGLGASERAASELPLVVSAVARHARAIAASAAAGGATTSKPATARAHSEMDGWLIVRGSLMGQAPDAPVTVMIEPARPAEMASFMVQAYGFTDAERRVTELVAQGLPTRQIANRLQVSGYTVQDHLKSIFTKSGTGSRGDLVARLFIDHFADGLTRPTA